VRRVPSRSVGPASLLVALVLAAGCSRHRTPTGPPLRVGVTGDYAPFAFTQNGAPAGFDVEVLGRFARETGRPLEIVYYRWPDLTHDLAAGRFDVAAGGVTVRPERALAGTFTRPVVDTGAVVLTRYAVARKPAELDRQGRRIAVNAGGHLERVARRTFQKAMIRTVPDNTLLPGLLDAGSVDAIVSDTIEADVFRATLLHTAVQLGPITRDRKAYLARDPALAKELDAWLRAREADGSLAALRVKWFGAAHEEKRTASESDVDALLALVDLRLSFMMTVAAAKERAGLPVADPNQEQRVQAAARARAVADGLAPGSVDFFFQAQIDAARAVQQAYLDTPKDARPPVDTLDLNGQLRPALAVVSDAIVDQAAVVAADPVALGQIDPGGLAARLDPSVATAADRKAIGGAIVGLRRVASGK